MNDRTHRDGAQRQAVASLDRRVLATDYLGTLADSLGGQDVATLAVGILDQGDMRAAVRVVLEPLDDTRNAVLVAPEIDDAVALLVTTAAMPDRDAAVVVAATLRRFLVDERSVRLALVQAVSLDLDDETAPGRGRLCFMK